MALKTKNLGGDFELAPEGTQVGRCYQIIDLGTHIDKKFGKPKHQVRLGFELPLQLMKDGKPFMVSKMYTLSHGDKSNLRADLESWYGKKFNTAALDEAGGFDLEKVMSRTCLLTIVHSEDGKYANIKTISPLLEGLECPPQVNPSFIFTLEEPDKGFAQLSDGMRKFILDCEELKNGGNVKKEEAPDLDDDIPF